MLLWICHQPRPLGVECNSQNQQLPFIFWAALRMKHIPKDFLKYQLLYFVTLESILEQDSSAQI